MRGVIRSGLLHYLFSLFYFVHIYFSTRIIVLCYSFYATVNNINKEDKQSKEKRHKAHFSSGVGTGWIGSTRIIRG